MNDLRRVILGLQKIKEECFSCEERFVCLDKEFLEYKTHPEKFSFQLTNLHVLKFKKEGKFIGTFVITDNNLLKQFCSTYKKEKEV